MNMEQIYHHLSVHLLYYKQIEYVDKEGKRKTKRDETAAPVLYAKLIYSDKSKKILSLFTTKGSNKGNPFDFLEQYRRVKIALIIEGIFISKTVTSLQIQVHEVCVKPLEPREELLTIKESDDDDSSIPFDITVLFEKFLVIGL